MSRLSCALLVGACSVYGHELLDTEAPGDETGGSAGSGGSVRPSAGSSGKAGSGDGGKSGSDSGDNGAAPSAGGMGEGEGGSSAQEGTDGGATGASEGGGDAGNGGAPPVTDSDLIDDFEDQNLFLAQTSGRGGTWYLFNDGTTGEAGPTPLVCSPLVEAPPALGSYAMHVTATGFSSWGSGVGADFRESRKVYDGSKHTGVRFWARVGQGKNALHRVQLADGTTDPLGGKCNPAPEAVDGEKCANHFGIDRTFTTTWTEYEVPFSALRQVGWGESASALDVTTLYGFQVSALANLEVDLWLDQIEFF